MPNNKGGKKYKKNKKFQQNVSSKLVLKNEEEGVDDQEYGQIKKVNGSGRYQVQCFDGTERLGISAGKIRKKMRIGIGDIVLFCKWEFQDEKCSIIHKYEDYEVSKLISMKEIPEQKSEFEDFEDSICFDNSFPEEEKTEETEEKSSEDEEDEEEDFFVDVNDI
tara:strand:+ start:799 stop:1290 length:492 start_codon:yes stop_codon:yes gene_type:complete